MRIFESINLFFKSFYRVPLLVPYWNSRETIAVLTSVVSGKVVSGEDIPKFENRVRELTGIKYVLGTNLGRSALEIGLRSLDMPAGSEVIMPTFICRSVADAVLRVGCIPVFADVDEDYNINSESIKENFTEKTRAIIVAHLFGKPANMASILDFARKNSLFVIDDAAQSMGAKYNGKYTGSLGDFGIFSFGAGKNVIASSGGMLVTNSEDLYDRSKTFQQGEQTTSEILKQLFQFLVRFRYRRLTRPFSLAREKLFKRGTLPLNYIPKRISNLVAMLGCIQLNKLAEIIEKRRKNAEFLLRCLSDIDDIIFPRYSEEHIFTNFLINIREGHKGVGGTERGERFMEFCKFLHRCGIETERS